jgi:hypothetical protein
MKFLGTEERRFVKIQQNFAPLAECATQVRGIEDNLDKIPKSRVLAMPPPSELSLHLGMLRSAKVFAGSLQVFALEFVGSGVVW